MDLFSIQRVSKVPFSQKSGSLTWNKAAMKVRKPFLVLTLLAFAAAAGGRPADKPNFTGTWRILQSRDAGTTLVVSHRGAKLEVTRKGFAMGITDVRQSLYYIDGETHFTEETNWIESSNKSRAKEPVSQKIKSVAAWHGDTLVIATDETREEWRLSEDGKELIVTTGTVKRTYRRFSERIDRN
jgi:hypothetical protein